MARLAQKPYPGVWSKKDDEDWDAYDKRIEQMFDSIDKNKLLFFPVADGKAVYFVKSEKPLVIQWVPVHDAWSIPIAHIRGLTMEDVRWQRKSREFWRNKT